ncbi:hypothetical protein BC938DRAFT_472930 [Jimgerdemannia flammicorona]|uniref:Uncharacterized protein n=1 Tax=Jimgerdemannia flammicorona TaxID=994334 RepID=A0A433Q543_9FUNG|nr:hypothetical protein BC938DRAFT_472930 [Jimgerdemannia flammicorona]
MSSIASQIMGTTCVHINHPLILMKSQYSREEQKRSSFSCSWIIRFSSMVSTTAGHVSFIVWQVSFIKQYNGVDIDCASCNGINPVLDTINLILHPRWQIQITQCRMVQTCEEHRTVQTCEECRTVQTHEEFRLMHRYLAPYVL